jgi:hypothetical protein
MFPAFCPFLPFSQSFVEYLIVFIKTVISISCNLLPHLFIFLYLVILCIISWCSEEWKKKVLWGMKDIHKWTSTQHFQKRKLYVMEHKMLC